MKLNVFSRGARKFASAIALSALAGLSAPAALAQAPAAPAPAKDRLFGIVEPVVAKKPLSFGLALVHLNDDFWRGIAYGVEDEARRSNVSLKRVFVAGAYGKVREQFAQLQALKTLGVDVAVLGAVSYDGFDPAVRDLKQAGMKVMAVGIPVNSASIDLGVGQDDSGIGKELANQLCALDAAPKVVIVPGPAGAEWARLRNVGFKEQLAARCKPAKVVDAPFTAGMTLQDGLTQTADLLLKNPDVNAVYTPAVTLSMGAAQAARQARRDVNLVTAAIVPEAIKLIKEGRIKASVSEPGILMGRLIVQYAIRQAEGLPLPGVLKDAALPYPYVMTPSLAVTPANVESFPFYETDIVPPGWNSSALTR